MIWCVAFSHPSFGTTVRGITLEMNTSDNTSENAKKAAEGIKNHALELGWPEDIQVDYVVPVYHDYFSGKK